MTTALVVAPHADDESLGCGGSILRHVAEGHDVHWLLVTTLREAGGYSSEWIRDRENEIELVAKLYGFAQVHRLDLPDAGLDTLPLSEIVDLIRDVVDRSAASILYVPHGSDAHSDHRITLDATLAAAKSYRAHTVKRLLAYQTLSETEFGFVRGCGFRPNSYVDIGPYLEMKLEIIRSYESELGRHPFPRSEEAVRALATLHGAAAGCDAAEAFALLKEIR